MSWTCFLNNINMSGIVLLILSAHFHEVLFSFFRKEFYLVLFTTKWQVVIVFSLPIQLNK
jgi:hypothetical protein